MPFRLFDYLPNRPSSFCSSKGSRHAGRTNLLTQTIAPLSIETLIGSKFMQAGVSFFTAFRTDIHGCERMFHITLSGLAAAQFAIAVTLFYQDEDCFNSTLNLCLTMELLNYIYSGALTLGQTLSETNKEEEQGAPPANAHPENAV